MSNITVTVPATTVITATTHPPTVTVGAGLADTSATSTLFTVGAVLPVPVPTLASPPATIGVPIWIPAPTPHVYAHGSAVDYFNVGGIAAGTSRQVFWIECVPVAGVSQQGFNIQGRAAGSFVSVFQIEGPMIGSSFQLFNVMEFKRSPQVGVYIDQPRAHDTLDGGVYAGATEVDVHVPSLWYAGMLVNVDGELRAVAGKTGSTVRLRAPLALDHASGKPIDSTPGFVPAMLVAEKSGLVIGGMWMATEVTLTSPYSFQLWNVEMQSQGTAQFIVPRTAPGAVLIDNDRLVFMQSELGDAPWAGSMGPQRAAMGQIEVVVDDIGSLLAGDRSMAMDSSVIKTRRTTPLRGGSTRQLSNFAAATPIEVPDNTPAGLLLELVVDDVNQQKAADGEVVWALEDTTTLPFRGDWQASGDAWSLIGEVIARSAIEIYWKVRLQAGQIVATLVAVDKVIGIDGADLFDGPGGNIVGGAEVNRNPDPVVNGVVLTGDSTSLASYLPTWAQFAVQEIQPQVTLMVDAGKHRRRVDESASVTWSLSKAEQKQIAAQIQTTVWNWYKSYVRSIHDIQGRPNLPGYVYQGVPSEYEDVATGMDALSRRSWHTRRQLVEVGLPAQGIDESTQTSPGVVPGAAVAVSDETVKQNLREWLVVTYDRLSGTQKVGVYGIPVTDGETRMRWTGAAPGSFLYKISAGEIVSREYVATETSQGQDCDPVVFDYYWPAQHAWVSLHVIVSGPRAFVWGVDVDESTNTFANLGAGSTVDAGGTPPFIGKLYDFEINEVNNWDPRRDGVGVLLNRQTIWAGRPVTSQRWHRISFPVGDTFQTRATGALLASHTEVEVESIFGAPDDPGFEMMIDDEIIKVTNMDNGADWLIDRGQEGTLPADHMAGATMMIIGVGPWQGLPFTYEWPEGKAWARGYLDKVSQQRFVLTMSITNDGDAWSTVGYGSIHQVDQDVEGFVDGYHGLVRVLGWAPSAIEGTMELLVEPYSV